MSKAALEIATSAPQIAMVAQEIQIIIINILSPHYLTGYQGVNNSDGEISFSHVIEREDKERVQKITYEKYNYLASSCLIKLVYLEKTREPKITLAKSFASKEANENIENLITAACNPKILVGQDKLEHANALSSMLRLQQKNLDQQKWR